jgi:hypothetical protein
VPKKQAASLPELIASSRIYRVRRLMRLIPSAPPHAPHSQSAALQDVQRAFAGPGRVFRLAGLGRSRKNPNMCNTCFERAPVEQFPVGAGADFGTAYVGNVGEEDVKDFTALGDVVNTAARLQARAEAGQLVVSE